MTDKEQIMINGVDVAGCKYFNRFRSICHNKNLCCDCEKNQDCYYKQLARKTQEYQNLADILRDTDTYSEVCNACKDDILIYPSISDKMNYTDNEVDAITLRRIINILEGKTQKYSELLKQHKELDDRVNRIIKEKYNLGRECEELKVRSNKYYEALADIEMAFEYDIEYGSGLHRQVLNIINKARDGK